MKYIIGIAPEETVRTNTIKIAKGEISVDESYPKMWFNSLSRCAEVFDIESIKLIQIIRSHQPTIEELSLLTNLSRLYLTCELEALFLYDVISYGVDGKILTDYETIEIRIDL